jgi:hypothetical protein
MKTKILIPRSMNFNRAGAEVTRLPGASADFVDPEWLHHPIRFYRARSD